MTEPKQLLIASIHDALRQDLATVSPDDRRWKLERTKQLLESRCCNQTLFRRALVELLNKGHDLEPLRGDGKWQVWSLLEEDWELARDMTLFALATFNLEETKAEAAE